MSLLQSRSFNDFLVASRTRFVVTLFLSLVLIWGCTPTEVENTLPLEVADIRSDLHELNHVVHDVWKLRTDAIYDGYCEPDTLLDGNWEGYFYDASGRQFGVLLSLHHSDNIVMGTYAISARTEAGSFVLHDSLRGTMNDSAISLSLSTKFSPFSHVHLEAELIDGTYGNDSEWVPKIDKDGYVLQDSDNEDIYYDKRLPRIERGMIGTMVDDSSRCFTLGVLSLRYGLAFERLHIPLN